MKSILLAFVVLCVSATVQAAQGVPKGTYIGLSLNAYHFTVPTYPGAHFSVFLKGVGIDLQIPPMGGLYAATLILNSNSYSVLPFLSFGKMLHREGFGNQTTAIGLQVSPENRKKLYFNGGLLMNPQVGVYSPYLSIGLRHKI